MILPFQTLRYTTQLPVHEVLDILRRNVGKSKWFSRAPEPFVGSVKDETFTIQRSIGYRNSFLPYLRGSLNPYSTGTEIRIRFWLHPVLLGFFLLVFVLPSKVSIVWISLIFLGICLAGFLPESVIAERNLKDMIPPALDSSAGVLSKSDWPPIK